MLERFSKTRTKKTPGFSIKETPGDPDQTGCSGEVGMSLTGLSSCGWWEASESFAWGRTAEVPEKIKKGEHGWISLWIPERECHLHTKSDV